LLVLAGAVALALVLLGVSSAPAAADVFRVTSTASGGDGSLRRAIQDANKHPGPDSIRFRIPGTGVRTITPTPALPAITDPVTVNGYTQPRASPNTLATGNDAVLRIQLDGSGFHSLPPSGVTIDTDNSTIKGLVVNRFEGLGIEIREGANGNTVEGSFIGTNPDGTVDRGNGGAFQAGDAGISLDTGNDNTIGGTDPAARNLISGNAHAGVLLEDNAAGTEVLGNYIGTDRHGATAIGNEGPGVEQNAGEPVDNVIGGPTNGARNVISGNDRAGVAICCFDGAGTRVEGNFIGTEADGTGAVGNGDDGVQISSAKDNTVGGAFGAGNRIAHNDADGVSLPFGTSATGNQILSNSIFSNGELGIDLGTDGVTANDTDDPDGGANRLQNFPVITSATRDQSAGFTTISGTLNSTPSQDFTIQCFVAAPDPSRRGEGRIPLGQTTATTDVNGDDNSFTCVSPVAQPGQVVTATATNTATGDTSEFSRNVGVTSVP
jgi:hypothetical protein